MHEEIHFVHMLNPSLFGKEERKRESFVGRLCVILRFQSLMIFQLHRAVISRSNINFLQRGEKMEFSIPTLWFTGIF